jgi:hypothetical protein
MPRCSGPPFGATLSTLGQAHSCSQPCHVPLLAGAPTHPHLTRARPPRPVHPLVHIAHLAHSHVAPAACRLPHPTRLIGRSTAVPASPPNSAPLDKACWPDRRELPNQPPLSPNQRCLTCRAHPPQAAAPVPNRALPSASIVPTNTPVPTTPHT